MAFNPANAAAAIYAATAIQIDPNRRIGIVPLCELCGVCPMTIRRWLADPSKNFPRPTYIGRNRFWRYADVIAWLDSQSAQAAAQ